MINDTLKSTELAQSFKMQRQFVESLEFEMNGIWTKWDEWRWNKYLCFDIKEIHWIMIRIYNLIWKEEDAMIHIDFNEKMGKTLVASTLQMIVLTVFN